MLVDSNIFIYAANLDSQQCVELFDRCRKGSVDGLITTVTLAECCHRWMMLEAVQKKFIAGSNPAKTLSSKPGVIKNLTDYAARVNGLIHGTLQIRSVETEDFVAALQLQRRWGLLTNDSLQLAVAERLGINEIATADSHFDAIQGLMVYKPDDLAA